MNEASSLLGFGKVFLQILGHGEGLDLLISEDGSHGLVRGEVLLALRVLEFLLLQVGPESLDTLNERGFICEKLQRHSTYLRTRDLLTLLGSDDLGQLRGHVELHLYKYQVLVVA